MLTKTKSHIRISVRDWERLKRNPLFFELIELLEDSEDLQKAKTIRGKNLSLDEYLKKRELLHHS